ncbi:hypothetical protein NYR05_10430 [Adlercreutzia mucosicola]|nr:hypothetical protein [Adlercreutzia mucosicola]MEB1814858.1 hypothetical protein [Adlercreutzia mucosicola]
MEHSVSLLQTRGIEPGQVEGFQRATAFEHVAHVRYLRRVQLRDIDLREILQTLEPLGCVLGLESVGHDCAQHIGSLPVQRIARPTVNNLIQRINFLQRTVLGPGALALLEHERVTAAIAGIQRDEHIVVSDRSGLVRPGVSDEG